MNDVVTWLIIAAFYAPMHYGLPILFLFITGQEDDATRMRLIKGTVIDSSISMIVVLAAAYWLVRTDRILLAAVLLFLSIFSPFLRIWMHRREITPD